MILSIWSESKQSCALCRHLLVVLKDMLPSNAAAVLACVSAYVYTAGKTAQRHSSHTPLHQVTHDCTWQLKKRQFKKFIFCFLPQPEEQKLLKTTLSVTNLRPDVPFERPQRPNKAVASVWCADFGQAVHPPGVTPDASPKSPRPAKGARCLWRDAQCTGGQQAAADLAAETGSRQTEWRQLITISTELALPILTPLSVLH